MANSPHEDSASNRGAGRVGAQGRGKAVGSRISEGSFFYTRLLPVLIVAMGVLTAGLVIFAAGVLLGLIPFR